MSAATTRVGIIDYGMGNLYSVAKAVEYLGGKAIVSDQASELAATDRIIFPGVGAFGDCMAALEARELSDFVRVAAQTRPFLGICLGMQMLMDCSMEHGEHAGLGLLPGRVISFPEEALQAADGRRLKIPHMGWNELHQLVEHPLFAGVPQNAYFYFVHSFYVEPSTPEILAAFSDYAFPFCAAMAADNLFALQCHPEKSGPTGLRLLGNFLGWDGDRGESCAI
ncbi:imidazole glycerol phosphate synthase subunit HisH [Acidithiobacillus ferriphilus]|uniref:imidazole glycerol phosphate synthase subunit HisH n=1 Tax=Acidithiobacillus ferriphilus TaxID=1689834 RepID=UPI001C05F78A|nr:imidazole glycerol phosphate synthase subunit HisH [Acidithiobacillus ferriphilus]MBU2784976.1 imidazole glycerol phosphate synthase subunit HisH [Acidithiobacillus ferriphilus]MBU2846914.1 imidazole glycerol phosphate synthase subunit HisH [Acidithiobacillus ferriphilus]MBU2853269.1 imidazole glycerol phosphate synthase subunit HisH [Acidithiobacillus ferriphilus]UEP58071.1 imidazole glycerol phosphate synthase subunit HisH [Acidithiobacillus ferriphilus]